MDDLDEYAHELLPALTPAMVMDLRGSCAMRTSDDSTGDRMGVPFIVYIPSDDAFSLHAYGSPQAVHKDVRVLAQVIRCERAEAGFIRRILSPQEPCDVATLGPDRRARYAHAQAAAVARRRQDTEDALDARHRFYANLDVTKLSLDDI